MHSLRSQINGVFLGTSILIIASIVIEYGINWVLGLTMRDVYRSYPICGEIKRVLCESTKNLPFAITLSIECIYRSNYPYKSFVGSVALPCIITLLTFSVMYYLGYAYILAPLKAVRYFIVSWLIETIKVETTYMSDSILPVIVYQMTTFALWYYGYY